MKGSDKSVAVLRNPRFEVDGWSLTRRRYLANVPRSRKAAYAVMKHSVLTRLHVPSVKELCVALGFRPEGKTLIRFRALWRDYLRSELPLLGAKGDLTHAQMLAAMQSLVFSSSRWHGDNELRKTQLLWFCTHIVDHTDRLLTNREINSVAFGKDDKDPASPNYITTLRAFREAELAKVLVQLRRIPVAEIVDGPSPRAGKLLKRIRQLWVPKLSVPPRIDAAPLIHAICDYVVASQGIVPTYAKLREILAFIPANNVQGNGFMPVLKQWRRDRGFPEALRGNMNPAQPRTWEMLVPTLGKAVRQAPQTFLDPRAKPGRYRKPHDEVAAQLGKCSDDTLRSALTLAVLSGCGNLDTIPSFSAGLSQIIQSGRLRGITDTRMEETLRAFVTGDLVLEEAPEDTDEDEGEGEGDEDGDSGDDEDEKDPRWSKNRIRDFLRLYRAASYAQQRYLQALPKGQRAQFNPYLLPKLQDQVFWRAANFNYIVEDAQRRRRKARTDALFPHRGLIRTLPEFRTNQAIRILTAFRIELAKHRDGQLSLPHDFTVREDEPHLGPPARHQFRLWSQAAIWARLVPSARDVDGIRRSYGGERYFVEYLGAIGDDDKPSTTELWFTDLIRFNVCHRGAIRDSKTAELSKSYGITRSGYKPLWAMLCASRKLSLSLSRLITDVRANDPTFRPVYFSPEGLHHVALFGRAANRILNVTGCRANELQQLYVSPDCMVKIQVEHRSSAYAFMAIPKLSRDLEPFFIDELCLKFIADLAGCIQKNSQTGFIPKVPGALNLAAHKRPKPRPYLFQLIRHAPRAMKAGVIGSLVRFMLHGLIFTTAQKIRFQPGLHDLRHLTGTILRSQGVPLEVIAKMFKQKDLKVTDYYSESTNSMVVAAMHGLRMAVIGVGAAAGIRKPGELDQQLKEANGVVGALTKVLGGDCTVSSPCAAKFACLGCAGLVPDPKQRPHVVRNKTRLQEDLAEHTQQGLLAEVRKNQIHIADCDRVIAEMDLQEAATIDATKEAHP